MHIVVNTNSVLDRSTIETFISVVPSSWYERIDVINVEPFDGDQIVMSYLRKNNILGIHIPNTYKGTRIAALEEVAITIQAIAEYRVIPNKISSLRLKKYKQNCKKIKKLLV